jgi:hypothetical protein
MFTKKNSIIFFVSILVLGAVVFLTPRDRADAPIESRPQGEVPMDNVGGSNEKCGIENCHGLDIICGENVADFCTMEYQLGDSCRKFARCEMRNGKCQMTPSDNFDECKTCVEKCKDDFSESDPEIWNCESDCHLEINNLDEAVLE